MDRKRHIVVDTDGRLLMVNLTPADLSDSAGAYDRTQLMDKAAVFDFDIEVGRRIDSNPGFKMPPRRWVVARTFAWLTRWSRLVRDYEQRLDVSEAMIHVAMRSLLLRRICY